MIYNCMNRRTAVAGLRIEESTNNPAPGDSVRSRLQPLFFGVPSICHSVLRQQVEDGTPARSR